MNKIKYHPLYEKNGTYWQKLIDSYEGSGGFNDGTICTAMKKNPILNTQIEK